jgi:hypothetical protein
MSKGKVMLELLFKSFGIVHTEFIPEGATANKQCYKIIHRLCNSIRCMRASVQEELAVAT